MQPMESEFQARKRYEAWTANHPSVHCNRFPAWSEMDQNARNKWIADNPPVLATDEDVANAGKEWIEAQIATLTPEQREAAALYFHGMKIGGPPAERFFHRLGLAMLTQPQWSEPYPNLTEVYRAAVNAKVYK